MSERERVREKTVQRQRQRQKRRQRQRQRQHGNDRHSLKAEKICRQVNKWGRGQAASASVAANSNGRTNRDGNNPTRTEEEKKEATPLQCFFFVFVLIGTHLPAAVAVTAPLHFTLSLLI